MKPVVSVVLAVCLLSLAFATAGAQACAVQHTVKPGENLYRIGLLYKVPWPQIATANNLANPNLIFIGQVLCIPGAGTPGPTASGPTPTRTVTPTVTATRVVTATVVPTATQPMTATAVPTTAPPSTGIPTFTIIGVARNASVTIRTANFPANQTFDVLMGPIGSLGIGGTRVATQASGAGGVFTATYPIASQVMNANQIAIRLQSASGYYSYNWFYNANFP
jgi:LysM repeat protein